MKFDVIVSDPPWRFQDKLSMSKIKRGAESQYQTMSLADIKSLKISEITNPNAILALWVPSSILDQGLEVINAWGFKLKQSLIWVKIKQDPWVYLKKQVKTASQLTEVLDNFDLDQVLITLMGHLFRQTHEVCLIATKGKVSHLLKNKSLRSVLFGKLGKHSEKPEELQDRLERMFPDLNYLEMFARRDRPNWTCVGLQCPSTLGEDIVSSIDRLLCHTP